MSTVSTSNHTEVKLNDLDWLILGIMSDGKRYTPLYLGKEVEELSDYKPNYVRRRVNNLYNSSLITRLGESSMYVINDDGRRALQLREAGEITDDTSPREVRQLIFNHDEPGETA